MTGKFEKNDQIIWFFSDTHWCCEESGTPSTIISVHGRGFGWCHVGRGRVTQFPFSPLNVFVYISHWAAQVHSFSKQVALWRWLSELMVNARFLMWFNWQQVEERWKSFNAKLERDTFKFNIFFIDWVAPAERFLYGCYWDPTPARRVIWG